MRALTIPKRYAGGLAKIMGLSPSQVASVVKALQSARSGAQSEVASLLTSALPGSAPEDTKAVAETLRSLYSARTEVDTSVEEFVSGLVAAIRQDEKLQSKVASESADMEGTLTELLSIHQLSVMSKARDLQMEFENTFCDARIITDVRPVFDISVKEGPVATVLTHTLKLEYHDNRGEHIEIHIALDKKEIETMIDILKRALDKAAALSDVVAKTGLKILAE